MEIYSYRAHIDKHMKQLLSLRDHPHYHDIVKLGTLGLHHEQQHQELLLTDIKHIFAYNPLRPVYKELPLTTASVHPNNHWVNFTGGLHSIGYSDEDFAYDNESPRHKVYLNDFQLAQRLVTNREYMQFMREGGYSESNFWLSDAWKLINTQNWSAPLYWEQIDGEWWHMTLAGMRRVDPNAPVSHVSYYEAAAYAQWAQARLPTEAEWEVAAADVDIKGNLRESGYLQPIPLQCDNSDNTKGTMLQMYGDVWEWTQSPYVSYPGYRQAQGAMGEYNGKFMSGQMVLRGGSCVTPNDHIRPSYRNFFYPNERWQFTGFRLARD
jgi:ergothioneine biosynthesis protein EgtB